MTRIEEQKPPQNSVSFREVFPAIAGSMVQTYSNIAEDAFAGFLDEKASLAASEASRNNERSKAYGIQTIVFAAMAIEAAAFEFLPPSLLSQEDKGEIDKWGLVRKWVQMPERLVGQPLEFESPAINGLGNLVKARNRLVHYKSKWENDKGTVRLAMAKEWEKFETEQVPNAFMTLVLLSLELNASPCGIFGGFPYHDRTNCPPGFKSRHTPHPGVKEVIDRCLAIHHKHHKRA
jgi:hypothetical protein